MPDREVLFEVVRRGAYVKVTAIDPVANVEATIIGPHSAGHAALQAAAVRKLNYVLRKRAKEAKG